MPPGPLVKATVIATIKARMLEMEFQVTDTNGNSQTVNPVDGPGLDQMATALGAAMFEILTEQVQTIVKVQLRQSDLQGGNAAGIIGWGVPPPTPDGQTLNGTGEVQ